MLWVAAVFTSIAGAATDSTAADRDTIAAGPVIVRRLEEVVVHAPLHDMRSSETVHRILPAARRLPVDGLRDLLALKAGVVARGEDLHVRGGRAGEIRQVLDGIELNEPLRDRPMEVPLSAVSSAELMTGGLDAEFGGSLAGVVSLETFDPRDRYEGELTWRADGAAQATRYDRVAGRVSGPLHVAGLGVVAAAEAILDNDHLPSLRSESRRATRWGRFGWRDDNRLLGYLKLAPIGAPRRVSLQTITSRRVERPYDPIWSFEGWIKLCPDEHCSYVDTRSTPAEGYSFYRAADHQTMTDERRLATILSWSTGPAEWQASGSFGWTRARAITSLGGSDDFSYIVAERKPVFGTTGDTHTDPYFVYWGDEPYFKRWRSDAWSARADVERRTARGNGIKLGLGATYHAVESWELDDPFLALSGVDTLRAYEAFAPGGFAYVQGRWEFQGLTLNTGLRLQYFTAGPQAERQRQPTQARGIWSLAPRLGITYPISVRDAFSLAYARIHQDPARDFLYESRRIPFNRHPLGNPLLEPATVVSYQGALKHLFERGWSLQLAYFYRDVFGEVGMRNVVLPNVHRPRYETEDQAHATGFEISLIRIGRGGNRLEAHYAYLHAWGHESREEGEPFGPRTGYRPTPIGVHPLDWDRRHAITLSGEWRVRKRWTAALRTVAGSGLPWTARPRRQQEADLANVNQRRLAWGEETAVALRFRPPLIPGLTVGLDVRNLFDSRSDARVTVDGYPHAFINTLYDDYSAYRAETGKGGGAYWDDVDGDGDFEWVPVHDLRLVNPPRTVRAMVEVAW